MLLTTIDQERWGTAIALLSLDSVEPFYQFMDIHLPNLSLFKKHLGTCIMENRTEFVRNNTQIADLKLRTQTQIKSQFGTDTATWFEDWVYNSFFFETNDFSDYYTCDYLFGLS